jgi:hypothetical protein
MPSNKPIAHPAELGRLAAISNPMTTAKSPLIACIQMAAPRPNWNAILGLRSNGDDHQRVLALLQYLGR